jgi:NADH oxidase (H2O-forming)
MFTIDNQHAVKIANEVYWIGALDPDLRVFDIILKTANGTTYNAYLVKGEDGVAIIDTVKEQFSEEFFKKIEEVANYNEIKYIVLNHLEPDHTGALPELLRRAPQAKVHISPRGLSMLKGLIKNETFKAHPVKTGDSISLGNKKLRFFTTPFLHWPDTQCTYLEEEQILFSGDIFGCHFCDGRLFNDVVGDFRFSFEYYYAHIMRPFKQHVLTALQLLKNLQIQLIAPAHGPILRDRPLDYLERYKQMSTPRLKNELNQEKSLLIFYLSSYGNTAKMAQAVYRGASLVEGVRASLFDLQGGEISPFVDLIEESDALAFGSPTINGDAVKPVWDLLASLALINTTGKLGAAFGSYGWSGEAVRMVSDRLRGLKLRVPLEGLRVKLVPTDLELQECEAFGQQLGELLTHTGAFSERREIDLSDL